MRKAFLILWCLLLFTYCHQRHFDYPTPASRLALLHAIVTSGKLSLDARPFRTPDKVEHNGLYYSDKAPGTTIVALPFFALALSILPASEALNESNDRWLVSSWLACAGALAIPAVLGACALWLWLRTWISDRWAFITICSLWLGSFPLPYSTLLFSHSLVIGCLSASLWLLNIGLESHSTKARHQNYKFALAGFLLGYAVASEYTAAIVALAIFLWAICVGSKSLTSTRIISRPALVSFLLVSAGGVPPLLMIPAYSFFCFNNPFVLPYSLQAIFPEMQKGFYSIGLPNAQTAWNILFSPARGLFFWSPVLLVGLAGYPELLRRSRGLFWLTYIAPLVHIVILSGRTWDWQAGFTLGPRYLSPILPLLALPVGLGLRRFPYFGIPLALYSFVVVSVATLTDACPLYSVQNPLTELQFPLLMQGSVSPNLGLLLGFSSHISVALYFAIFALGFILIWRGLDRNKQASHSTSSAPTSPFLRPNSSVDLESDMR